MSIQREFRQFMERATPSGTGTAASYVRALELLGEMIASDSMGFEDCRLVWNVVDAERLQELYVKVLGEQRCFASSRWRLPEHPQSYLRDGYCSAAIRKFQQFLIQRNRAKQLMQMLEDCGGQEERLQAHLSEDIAASDERMLKLIERDGGERLAEAKMRVNQGAFRSVIFTLYEDTCCVTGIDIPSVNRASHIIPWADRRDTRLDPRNGLCLSATYDAAFDRHLISFDDDYRLIVSQEITENYDSEAVEKHFMSLRGKQIRVPERWKPNPGFLREHFARGRF